MKKYWLWASVIIVFLITSIYFISQRNSFQNIPVSSYFYDTYQPADFTIDGIGLGSSAAKVIEKFGTPAKRSQTTDEAYQNPDYMVYWDTWNYPGLTIKFLSSCKKNKPAPKLPDKVFSIIVSSTKYETFRGIKIGDQYTKVLEKYGATRKEDNSYNYGVDLLSIQFKISKGIVTKIILDSTFD